MPIRMLLLMLIGWTLLAACNQSELSPTLTQQGTKFPQELPLATIQPKPSQDLFLRPTVVTRTVTQTPEAGSEAQEPWCWSLTAETDHLTPWDLGPDILDTEELDDYLKQMGVVEICIPRDLDAPSLEVDWNAVDEPPSADDGRRIEITFGGIEGLYLVFATYDFTGGSGHVTHATAADYEALQAGKHENAIVTNGQPGFLFVGDAFGSAEKAAVFPFANHYVALAYRLGSGMDPDELTAFKEAIAHPPYPQEIARELNVLDEMIGSLRLREVSVPTINVEYKEFSSMAISAR